MRVAHLADLHLGYRAYHRLVPGADDGGTPRFNARERDVANAFRAALDGIIEMDVDLVLIAGDIFHTVRPSNSAIADAFRQFARLNQAMPAVPVVIIAGNHDSPRAVETGSILTLLQEIPNVWVVDREARVLEFPELDAAVMCLPHNVIAGGSLGQLEPTTDAGTQILMMHATVRGEEVDRMLGYVSEFGGAQVDMSDIRVERWDYVALGHYHIATQLAPNVWYSGALERTSTNIWIETGAKGFVIWDSERRDGSFHPVATRAIAELPRFSAWIADEDRFMTPTEVDTGIRSRVEQIKGGIGGKIVRLIIDDVPRDLFRELDHRRLREYRSNALHFHVDARRPARRPVAATDRTHTPRPLEDEATEFLTRTWQPTSGDIDRDRLVSMAQQYLALAGDDSGESLLVAPSDD